MPNDNDLIVEVAYATPGVQALVTLKMPEGASLGAK